MGISCKTTLIIVEHNLVNELDLPDTIERILGRRWKILFNSVSIGFLFACALINIILNCQLLYPVLGLLLEQYNIGVAAESEFTFSKVSYQWFGLIYSIVIFPAFFFKSIGPLLRLLSYGAISICTSVLFIIFKGSQKMNEDMKEVKLFTNDIAVLSGVFSLAFMGQSMIVPITRNNINQQNNKRDTKIAFIWTWIVYALIGIFGSLAMCGQSVREGMNGSTLLDYYAKDDYIAVSLQILIFLQLTTAFPVIQFISRARFFGLIYGSQKPPKWQLYLYSFIFGLSCLSVQLLNTNLSLVISLAGAAVGLFIVYLIPIAMHLQCLYGIFNTKAVEDIFIVQEASCKDHQQLNARSTKTYRFLFYGAIQIIGLCILGLRLYTL